MLTTENKHWRLSCFPFCFLITKKPILIGFIFTILARVCLCVPEERADTHQSMDDIIGRKRSKFYLFLLLWNSVSVLPVHWGLCINTGSLKVARVSFILPWTSCVPLGIFINPKSIPFTCKMRKTELPWAVNKLIFLKEPSRVLGKLFLLQWKNVEHGRRLYSRGIWSDNSKYSKNPSCN